MSTTTMPSTDVKADITDPQKGFTCRTCGTYHRFDLWVHAHHTEELIHKCDCGAKHEICDYKVTLIEAGKMPTA